MTSLYASKGRVPPPTRKLVIRKANSQRDLRPITDRLTLEKVLGLTASSNAALACNPENGIIAYPAGCTVVLFNPRRSKQEFIHNVCKKTVTALSFSKDGKYLATGESGHMPSVRVWSMEDNTHPQVSEMNKGHKHGVACVAFSPNLKFLVSVGYLHDMLINVWNWRDGSTVACNKFSTKVYAISFSELGDFFVTSGVRHVKFWYIDTNAKVKHDVTIPIKGRAGLLGELRSHTFCDVVCGVGSNSDYTYCVTTAGALCCFNAKRKLEKFVEIGSSKALCMVADEKVLICGYNNGYIRVFDASSLEFIATFPKPHYLGVNVADGINPSHMIAKTDDVAYGDTVAMALDSTHHRLTCIYSDHSLYVWDISDVKKVGKIWSSLYHSACVWGVEVYPDVVPGTSHELPLPPGTFFTCSNDDTVRVWNIEEGLNISSVKNIYSKELLRILYVDDSYSSLKDSEMNPTSKNVRDVGPESKSGVRCIRASPDGQLLAVGERTGNVRIYACMFLDEILNIDAHESEVLCLEFSPPESGYKLLASAGRDRLIHVFDVNKDFTLIQTLDDHSASITSIKFSVDENYSLLLLSCSADKSIIFRSAQKNPDLQFVRNTNYVGKTTLYDMVVDLSRGVAAVACQDRNIRIYDSHTGKQTKCYKGAQSDDGTLVKITMDTSGYFAATSSSDKSLSLYEFDTGECMATMSGHSEIVTGMRFTNDLKKLITVSGDGCIFIWTIPSTYTQYMTERLCELGQEPPRQPETPLRRGTYKVDGASTISIESLNGLESPSSDFIPQSMLLEEPTNDTNPPIADYRFSIGQLPSWAKKQIIAEGDSPRHVITSPTSQDHSSEVHSSSSSMGRSTPENNIVGLNEIQLLAEQSVGGPSQPSGRWAQRATAVELHINTETSPQRPVSLPLDLSSPERKKFNTGSVVWQEQVDVLSKSPLERKCSLTKGEDDDLFQVNNKVILEPLKEDEVSRKAHQSKNQESRSRKISADLVFIETEEIKFEEAKESTDDDVKESIIYFPQSHDDIETETASSFPGVREMTRRFESLTNTSSNSHQPVGVGSKSLHHTSKHYCSKYEIFPLGTKNTQRSFHVTAAQKPERRSVGDEVQDNTDDKDKVQDESSSEDEEDPLSVLEDIKPDDDTKTNDKSNDEEEGQEEVKKYFECLASTPTEETPPELPKEPSPESNKIDKPLPFLGGRLSISARFLSRSLLTSGRNAMDTVSEEQRTISLEEHKQEILRKREEMTRSVDMSRRRLIALRKAKEERELKNSQISSVSSISITLKPSPPRRISLDVDPAERTLSTESIDSDVFTKQHRSISSPFPVPLEQLTCNVQPEKDVTDRCQSPGGRNGNPVLNPVVTNLFEGKRPSLHDQLIPERDENVWVKRDEKENSSKHTDRPLSPKEHKSNISGRKEPEKDQQRSLNEGNKDPRLLSNGNASKLEGHEMVENNSTLKINEENSMAGIFENKKEKAKERKENGALTKIINGTKDHENRNGKELKEQEIKDRQMLELLKAKKLEEESLKAKLEREEEERRLEVKRVEEERIEMARKEEEERAKKKREKEEFEKAKKDEERRKEEEKQKAIEEKKKKEQEIQKQRELEKEEQEKQKEIEKAKELEREKLKELEKAKELQRQKDLEKEKEKEREKQRELEKAKEEEMKKQKEVEKVKELEREKEKQRAIEKETEEKAQKKRELEKAKRGEKEQEKQREIEKEKERQNAKQKDDGKEKEQEKREVENAKEEDKQKQKDKDKKDSLDESKENKKDKPKMEKRGSSSSLMAQTKSSWRKSLGFSGFKSKDRKEDRRDSQPFANSLRISDHPKRSEKVLFRDKRGKMSAEDRKGKCRSMGDLDAKLRPLREEIRLDSSVPPSRVVTTEDIPSDRASGGCGSRIGAAAQTDRRDSDKLPVAHRRSPVGKAEVCKSLSKFQMYQDAVSQLNQAIKSITDLHEQVLEEDNSDDRDEMLSLLANTFTDTEEHCKQLRLRSSDAGKPRDSGRPLSGNFSFSMSNIDTAGAKSTGTLNKYASEACVATAVEQDDDPSRDLLMRYSDILVEMVKQKLGH